ncbi:MAG TPA: hypothetical protein P5048_04785 [Chlamydiales bacterium]|nr:hypothetical protein [Chlamydiales bacterium]
MTAAINFSKNYLLNIPKDTPKQAACSFIYSTFCAKILTNIALNQAYSYGLAGACATIIHALTAPIFKLLKKHSEDPDQMIWYMEIAKRIVCLTITNLIIQPLFNCRFSHVFSALSVIASYFFFPHRFRHSSAATFTIF